MLPGVLALLCAVAAAQVAVPPAAPARVARSASRASCPTGWENARIGGCWTEVGLFDGEDAARAYVHPAGWVIDPRCFKRFGADALLAALDAAARKIDPGVRSEAGGCLGTFNPDWGRELKGRVWSNRMYVQCPASFDAASRTCADTQSRDAYLEEGGRNVRHEAYYRLITLRNAAPCMVEGSSGLAGILFHETLHAADADNLPLEEHNKGWEREQYRFVYDRVYGTEAVCFFGKAANIVQCRRVVEYETPHPAQALCRGFDAHFTDFFPGLIKH